MKKILLILIVCTFNQLYGQGFTNFTAEDGVIDELLGDLIVDENGNYWYVHWASNENPGIGFYDGKDWIQIDMGEGPSGNNYNGLYQSSDGTIWFGLFVTNTETGIDTFLDGEWTHIDSEDGFTAGDVGSIVEDDDGNMWFGTLDGLWKYDFQGFTNFNEEEGLVGDGDVVDMIVDNEGSIWFAVNSSGVSKYDGVSFTDYTAEDGLSFNAVFEIYEDDAGNIWVGTFADTDAVNRFNGTIWETFGLDDGILDVTVRAINGDNTGKIYFGTNEGISIYDGNSWSSLTEEDGLVENHVRGIDQDLDGNMVFSTWGGISVYNPTLSIFDNLKENFIVYPNPAENLLKLKSKDEIINAKVVSMTGKLLINIENKGIDSINISNLKIGVYWVQVTDINGLTGFKKFIVQ